MDAVIPQEVTSLDTKVRLDQELEELAKSLPDIPNTANGERAVGPGGMDATRRKRGDNREVLSHNFDDHAEEGEEQTDEADEEVDGAAEGQPAPARRAGQGNSLPQDRSLERGIKNNLRKGGTPRNEEGPDPDDDVNREDRHDDDDEHGMDRDKAEEEGIRRGETGKGFQTDLSKSFSKPSRDALEVSSFLSEMTNGLQKSLDSVTGVVADLAAENQALRNFMKKSLSAMTAMRDEMESMRNDLEVVAGMPVRKSVQGTEALARRVSPNVRGQGSQLSKAQIQDKLFKALQETTDMYQRGRLQRAISALEVSGQLSTEGQSLLKSLS